MVPTFHKQRQRQDSFPYIDPPEPDDTDDGSDDRPEGHDIDNRLLRKRSAEPLGQRSVDPYYFVGSATPLAMYSIGEAFGKSNHQRGSISPPQQRALVPRLDAMGGGTMQWTGDVKHVQSNFGTKHGNSSAPIPAEEWETFEDADEDDEALRAVKIVTRAYRRANLLR